MTAVFCKAGIVFNVICLCVCLSAQKLKNYPA